MGEIQIQTTGHLTRDPEITYTPSGQAVVKFQVAVTPRKKQGDQWVDGETTFLPCEAWRNLAEHIAESLSRGDLVMVSGVLRTQRWKDKEGADREKLVLNVNDIGPSLQWATARPQKAQREDRPATGQPPAQQPQSDPWATSATQAVQRQLGGQVITQDPPF
jgi:single-strand DNA-binding protein